MFLDAPDQRPSDTGASGAHAENRTKTPKDLKREQGLPPNMLEKGLIYFFFRGRVGIENAKGLEDVARAYIVLRPLPLEAKIGDGPIEDHGHNRLLALPKKVLPRKHRDRFMYASLA